MMFYTIVKFPCRIENLRKIPACGFVRFALYYPQKTEETGDYLAKGTDRSAQSQGAGGN